MSKRKDMLKKLLSVTLAVCMTVPMWSAPFAEDAVPVSSSSDTTVSSSSDATDLDLSGAADPDADGAADPDTDGAADPNTDGAADPDADGAADPDTDGAAVPDADGAADPDADGAADPDADGAAVPSSSDAADPDADGDPVEADKSVTAWTWDDPDGSLQQDGDEWVLGLAGVSELTDDVWAGIRDTLLPQTVTATVGDGSETVALTWTLTGSTAAAALAEGYTLAETAPALAVRLETGGATTYADADVNPIVTPQNINGTTIDVFDYWVKTQNAIDWNNSFASGINNGHVLMFGKGMGDTNYGALEGSAATGSEDYAVQDQDGNKYWNGWSGAGSGPVNGIVSRTLGTDGFPTLDLSTSKGWAAANGLGNIQNQKRTESLAYLFDPNYLSNPDDPTSAQVGKASFSNVSGLLQVDNEGYYFYDSRQNFASLVDGLAEEQRSALAALDGTDSGYLIDGAEFVLYERPGVRADGKSSNGQFFPFNGKTVRQDSEAQMTLFPDKDGQTYNWANVTGSTNAGINHYFGVHMQTRFIQQYDGHTTAAKTSDMTYEFSGDDDVWIFIDGVLVADLGGIHDAVKVKINFSTGQIEISSMSTNKNGEGNPNVFRTYDTTLYKQFEAAKKQNSVSWDSSSGYTIFADNTYHTLDFFYLERGNVDSNMCLKYNLITVPESSIVKVDQTGDRLADVGFSLYLADENYNLIDIDTGDTQNPTPLASGTTDANGTFLLKDQDDYLLSLDEIWRVYTSQIQSGRLNLVLRETSAPNGYRTSQEVRLYLVESGGNVVLLSDNQWESGAYAYSNVAITVGGDGKYIRYNGSNGAVALDPNQAQGFAFAVVLRRDRETADPLTDEWSLVTGDAVSGWNVSAPLEQGKTGIGTLLAGLKAVNPDGNTTNNYFKFNMTSSGAFVATVTDLPGSILEYYYMLDADKKNDAEMTLAFYYTTASSLENATATNTFRVTGDSGENSTTNDWDRLFATNVYVPNIKNRLLVQKLSTSGTTLTGAAFALYNANDVTVNADGTVDRGKLTGKKPVDTVTTANLTQEANGITLNGGGVFPTAGKTLNEGAYYLIETQAPSGYTASDRAVKVIVDHTGVYADAGEADDGVTVARGVGSIVKSMTQFATEDEIDATLHNIVAKFYTVPSNKFTNSTIQNDGEFVWRTIEGEGGDDAAFTANTTNNVTYHPAYYYDETNKKLYAASQVTEEQAKNLTPIGMHLEYDPTGARLEYTAGVIAESYPAIATVAQVTDTGWSALLVEQCYQHTQALASDHHVENLTGANLTDLTDLFSGTVTVRVENKPATSLTISKTAENEEVYGVTTFDFEVSVPVADSYTYSIYHLSTDGATKEVDETGTVTFNATGRVTAAQTSTGGTSAYWTANENAAAGTANLKLGDGQYAAIEAIPQNTAATATEIKDASWSNYCTTTVSVNKGTANTDVTGTTTLAANGDNTLDFTNTFRTGTITVRKQGVVNGADGTPLTGAGFTLTDKNNYTAVGSEELTNYAVRVEFNVNDPDYNATANRITVNGVEYIVHKNTSDGVTTYYYYRDPVTGEVDGSVQLPQGSELVAIARFENLRLDHTYSLEETTVPAGYRPANGNALVAESIQLTVAAADIHYIVSNTKMELPVSGGHGVMTVTALGFAMILGGGALLATSRKRKKN